MTDFENIDNIGLSDQDKVVSLFSFLKDYSKIRQQDIKDINKHQWHLMISDIPSDGENIKLSYRDRVDEEENSTANSDVILSVHKPEFQKCPQPDDSLIEWLRPGWDDYHKPANVKESVFVPIPEDELVLVDDESVET